MENPQDKEKNLQPSKKQILNKNSAKMMAIEVATEFAFMIAVPVILFVYGGKWLDAKYHVKYFVVIGFFVALAISIYLVGSRINKIRNKLK